MFLNDLDDPEKFKAFEQKMDTFNNYFLDDKGLKNQQVLAQNL